MHVFFEKLERRRNFQTFTPGFINIYAAQIPFYLDPNFVSITPVYGCQVRDPNFISMVPVYACQIPPDIIHGVPIYGCNIPDSNNWMLINPNNIYFPWEPK